MEKPRFEFRQLGIIQQYKIMEHLLNLEFFLSVFLCQGNGNNHSGSLGKALNTDVSFSSAIK